MVVADGMGGHRHGEVAAQIAVRTLIENFQREASPLIQDPFLFLQDAMLRTHCNILDFAEEHAIPDSPRTTCVACLVQNNIAYWAHAGDSRLYLFRGGKILTQTRDHSRVQLLLDQGLITPAQAAKHPERNKVYCCLGGSQMPEIEYSRKTPLEARDMLVLCTDGLWGPLSDKILSAALQRDDLKQAIFELLDVANQRGGPMADNLSIIAVRWENSHVDATSEAANFVSTQAIPDGSIATEMGDAHDPEQKTELSEDEIEHAIQEIQNTLQKYSR